MTLMEDLVAKGTTRIRTRLGMPSNLIKVGPIDDCFAGSTTIAGDIEYRAVTGQLERVFYDMKFSIATTQAMTTR